MAAQKCNHVPNVMSCHKRITIIFAYEFLFCDDSDQGRLCCAEMSGIDFHFQQSIQKNAEVACADKKSYNK